MSTSQACSLREERHSSQDDEQLRQRKPPRHPQQQQLASLTTVQLEDGQPSFYSIITRTTWGGWSFWGQCTLASCTIEHFQTHWQHERSGFDEDDECRRFSMDADANEQDQQDQHEPHRSNVQLAMVDYIFAAVMESEGIASQLYDLA